MLFTVRLAPVGVRVSGTCGPRLISVTCSSDGVYIPPAIASATLICKGSPRPVVNVSRSPTMSALTKVALDNPSKVLRITSVIPDP